jgi:hypothetical protein
VQVESENLMDFVTYEISEESGLEDGLEITSDGLILATVNLCASDSGVSLGEYHGIMGI